MTDSSSAAPAVGGLPQRIRQLRQAHKPPLGQRAVADLCGVSERAVQTWEAGGNVSWPNLVQLARVLNTTPEWLLNGDEPASSDSHPPPGASVDERLTWVESQVSATPAELRQMVADLAGRISGLEQAVEQLTAAAAEALAALQELSTASAAAAEHAAAATPRSSGRGSGSRSEAR